MYQTHYSAHNLSTKVARNSRYEVIQDLRNVSQSLEKSQQIRQSNNKNLINIKKRVSALQFKQKKNCHQTIRWQKRLTGLVDAQNYTWFLHQLKHSVEIKKNNELSENKTKINSFRQNLKIRKQKYINIFNIMKTERIKNFKEEHQKIMQKAQQRNKKEKILKKQQRQRIYSQQKLVKQRLKRYEKFKLDRSYYNYQLKLQQEQKKNQNQKYNLNRLKIQQKQKKIMFQNISKIKTNPKILDMIFLTNQQQK